MDRRTYLKSAVGATAGAGLAGCLGGGGDGNGSGGNESGGDTTESSGETATEGGEETTESGGETTEDGETTESGGETTETAAGNESMDETGTEGAESTAGNESGNASAGDMELPETVTIGSDIPYRPFEFRTTEDDELTGFDVDIAAAVFEEQLGIGYEFTDTSFDTIIPSLNNGNFRVIMSAMTINDERDEQVDFSDPYFTAYQTIIVLEGSDISAKSDLQGQAVGVQKGTTGANAAEGLKEEFGGDLEIKRYDQIPAAFDALRNNQVVAVVNDNTVNAEFANQEGSGARFLEGEGAAANASSNATGGASPPPYLTLTVEEYGIAFREDDDALLQRVNEALAAIREDGTYDEIYSEYFSG
ncbi:basic amino acid ABC transporter substrate-binding protein [Halococcus agarilyticus]|uniref:basic amino acid ABC transporter substrate-binding protein n=1 Tax=Halococcus agarilyticus TaxID=1232219 RepID=UPI000677F11D|nr:basic amino acid ABC transporter substrate-binding protein [Halococcus agarilyticus]